MSDGHKFRPWQFDAEIAHSRWVRWCATCPPERGHHELSASARPPMGALAEMPPWERDLVQGMTETEWVAASRRGLISSRREAG